MHTDRLAPLMRLALAGATEGEQLAAFAAFRRVMEAEGLDIHDVAARLEGSGGHQPGRGRPERVAFDEALRLAQTFNDDYWPQIAEDIAETDDEWYAGHGRRLLAQTQRRFVDEIGRQADEVRPTLRQCAWLIVLLELVHTQAERPEPQAQPPAAPAPRLPAPPRRVEPRRITSRPDQLFWVAQVVSVRRLGPSPQQDAVQPPLFTDAEVRVLTWLGTQDQGWTIPRFGRPDVKVERPQSAGEIAAGSHVSLRTVRRTLAKARAAGYLLVDGRGRGRRTIHRLTLPPERLRHDQIQVRRPRRRSRSAPNST